MSCHCKLLVNFGIGILLIITTGCFKNFYKIKFASTGGRAETAESIKRLQGEDRYFILHSGDKFFHLGNVALNAGEDTLSGSIDILPANHKLYVTNGPKENFKYKKSRSQEVLSEAHLYIQGEDSIKQGHYTLPTDKIQTIEVIKKDGRRTRASYISSAVGVGLLAILVFLGIVLGNVPVE